MAAMVGQTIHNRTATDPAVAWDRADDCDCTVLGSLAISPATLDWSSVVSVGVVAAGALITYTGWQWLDPTVSLGIVAVITMGTWRLLRKSVAPALDAVPEGIDPAAVKALLTALPGVTSVHDLHI